MGKTEITFEKIKQECKIGEYGTWIIQIVAFAGEVIGYNEIEKFKKKFRASDGVKPKITGDE